LLFVALTCLIACSTDPVTVDQAESAKSNQKFNRSTNSVGNLTDKDIASINQHYRIAMISFVDNVKLSYEHGYDYEDLKGALDPKNHLKNISKPADDLLFQAYIYIVEETPREEISSKKMIMAAISIFETDQELVTNPEQINQVAASDLFGLPDDYEVTTNSGGCKWYQVGCHLDSFLKWWNTPIGDADDDPSNDNDKTRGEVIGEIVETLTDLGGLLF